MTADISGLKRNAMFHWRAAADRCADAWQRELVDAAPVDTGELANSIKVSARQTGPETFTITAETGDLIQANTTNTGARPHIIRARRARTLAFYWPKVGRVVHPVFVRHPGNRGTHWWDRVRDRRDRIFAAAFRQ